MKVEYCVGFDPRNPMDSLVRIYNFEDHQIDSFLGKLVHLIQTGSSIHFDQIKEIVQINCNIVLSVSEKDVGLVRSNVSELVCYLTKGSYQQMREKISSYILADRPESFQWLYDCDCEIDFLLSRSGLW